MKEQKRTELGHAAAGHDRLNENAAHAEGLSLLQWSMDERTAHAASKCSLIRADMPAAKQFDGRPTSAQTWNDRVVQPATWNGESLISSPDEIIEQFQAGRYTQALVLVVSWGRMGRTSPHIYGTRSLDRIEQIERTLGECEKSIQKSRSIADSWEVLTGRNDDQLRWSSVIASKTLHFLCRSVGFKQNPPVPIDSKMIRERAWPIFKESVPVDQFPDDWEGNSFVAYGRYMTAILTWATQKHWTTTQVEATIVDMIESDKKSAASMRCSTDAFEQSAARNRDLLERLAK
jgi:hypothetical protein